MWLSVTRLRILGLFATILSVIFQQTFAQTIEVASVDHERFDLHSTDQNKGITLNGIRMINGSLLKLTNPDYFGPSGIVPYTFNFTHTFATSGSITEASLAPFQILFMGADYGRANPLTQAEQAAIKKWSIQPGKVVIIGEQPFNYPLTASYGYYLADGNTNPSTVGAGDNTTRLFSGVFGNSTQINQGGDSQGYFTVDCFSTVIAKDALNRPTIIFHTETRDIILGDTDFFTRIGNVSNGPVINNPADRVWANLWAWAVKEVVNPGSSVQPVITDFSNICNSPDGVIRFTSPVGISSKGEPYQYSVDGTTYQSSPVFSNLGPGTYKTFAKTASCPSAQGDNIVLKVIQPSPKVSAVPMNCTQPTTRINLSELPASGNYAITRQSGGVMVANTSGDTYTDTNVSPGSYTYTVTNTANGCTSLPTEPVKVESPIRPVINAISRENPDCSDKNGNISIDAKAETAVSYSSDAINFTTEPVLKGLSSGEYTVIVKDNNDCVAEEKVTLSKNCVHTPSAFSPNADAFNGSWAIYFEQPKLQVKKLNIFNRWGGLIYTRDNFEVVSGDPIWNGEGRETLENGSVFVCTMLIEFDDKQTLKVRQEVVVAR